MSVKTAVTMTKGAALQTPTVIVRLYPSGTYGVEEHIVGSVLNPHSGSETLQGPVIQLAPNGNRMETICEGMVLQPPVRTKPTAYWAETIPRKKAKRTI